MMKRFLAPLNSWRNGKAALAMLLAALAIFGMARIAQRGELLANSFAWPAAFVLLALWNHRFLQASDTRMKICAFAFGMAFALSLTVGYQMHWVQSLESLRHCLLLLCTALCLAPAVAHGWMVVYRLILKLGTRPVQNEGSKKKIFWIYVLIILLCWLPVFLAFYPGVFDYDAHSQVDSVITGQFSTANPLLHTLVLDFFYWFGGQLGSYTTGIAMYSAFQMLLTGLAVAYALTYLYQQGCARIIRLICLLFFALCPFCAMLSISVIKDAFFSAGILLLVVFLHDGYQRPEHLHNWRYWLRLILTVALVCLLRNNGVIAVGISLVVGFFLLRRMPAVRLRICAVLLCGILLFAASSFALLQVLDASPGPLHETLAIPMQQVALAYNRHKADIEYAWKIPVYMAAVDYYHPYIADYVKRFSNVGTGNVLEFAEIWVDLLVRYPLDYVDAFLLVNQGNWFIDDLTHAELYGVSLEGRTGYLMINNKEGYGVELSTQFPALEALYLRLLAANEYQQIPLAATLFAPALYTWLACFLVTASIYAKRRDILLCTLILAGLSASLFLGACALIRYTFPLVLSCPILLGLLIADPAKARPEISRKALP